MRNRNKSFVGILGILLSLAMVVETLLMPIESKAADYPFSYLSNEKMA